MMARRALFLVGFVLPLLAGCASVASQAGSGLPAPDVPALRETEPVGTGHADAADDPAIWRNASDPAASLILGTDKKAGLYVYRLDGKVRDFVKAGAVNNVDLRKVEGAGHAPMILVGASDRNDKVVPRIALFRLDGQTGKLQSLGSFAFLPRDRANPAEAYGFCMGPALADGELARAYVVLKDGEVTESRLVEDGGAIRPEYVRSVTLASQAEGCVVDDGAHALYVAEEDVAIWRIALNETAPTPARFASVGDADGLVADIEGLTIAHGAGGGNWLIASSQGDNAYAVFDLATGSLEGRFRIAGGAVDGTSDTDGIAVDTGDFGDGFSGGLFVAQDGDNAPDAQNFKLVPWKEIRQRLTSSKPSR